MPIIKGLVKIQLLNFPLKKNTYLNMINIIIYFRDQIMLHNDVKIPFATFLKQPRGVIV